MSQAPGAQYYLKRQYLQPFEATMFQLVFVCIGREQQVDEYKSVFAHT